MFLMFIIFLKLKLQNKTSHVAYTVELITWFTTPNFWRENTDFPLVDYFFHTPVMELN
jgi:hypothetical protein